MKSATELFEELRLWRNTVAEQMHREPYMVLQNSVLLDIAIKQPLTLAALSEIKGLGKTKISQFGHDILALISGESETLPKPETPHEALLENVYSVSELIDSINRLLSFQQVVVEGEIGSVDRRGRYTFFTLLDPKAEALINCFVWEERLRALGATLSEGMTVQVAGHPNIYKRSGRLTFEVDRVSLLGEGELKAAFARLKERLTMQGYFDPARKRPMPPYVRRIGLITSSYADAKKDFLTHLGDFGFLIDFYHIRVEGLYAASDITQAIAWFNRQTTEVDVIILTRGGGSLDSMQAFNNEEVAATIFASRIPVLTGIGHENDLSIADLVADRYASTPTDAGRILSEDFRQLTDLLMGYERYFVSRVGGLSAAVRQQLAYFAEKFIQVFETELSLYREKLRRCQEDLLSETNRLLAQTNQILTSSEKLLKAYDPAQRLSQGYSIVRNEAGNVIKSSRGLTIGSHVSVQFAKGGADAEVKKVHHEK